MAKSLGPGWRDDLSVPVLQALRDSGELLRSEIELARVELREEVRRVKRGVVVIALGVSLLVAALALLVVAVCESLGGGVELVAASGVALALLGGIATYWGRRALLASSVALPKTRQAVARNALLFRRATSPHSQRVAPERESRPSGHGAP